MNDQSIAEEWRTIPGYEGLYSVSSLGSVRRDQNGRGNCTAGRILKPSDCKGYTNTTLSRDRCRKTYKTHRLVAMVFIGHRPPGMDINHIDGNKSNNAAHNLEYVTHSENCAHARNVLGKHAGGERNRSSKLTEKSVKELRERHQRGGIGYRRLAREYGVDRSVIYRAIAKITWKRVA